MKEFRCGDLVPGCPTTFQGESEEEILQQVEVHARDEHGMDEVPPEVVDEVRAGISDMQASRAGGAQSASIAAATSSMTAACNAPLITKLRRRSREDANPALGALIEDVESYLPDEPPTSPATQPVVSLNLRTPLGEVSLFTVIATLGAPLEVTAADLAIETFLPMDERSAARLRELSGNGRGA